MLMLWTLGAVFTFLLPLPGQAAPTAKSSAAQVAWRFEAHGEQDISPRTSVFLCVGSRRILVLRNADEPFQVIGRQDYKEWKVPASALAACTGWWAGAGDVLYVVRRGKSLIVFRREEDEQAPAFSWKRLQVIPLH